MRVDKYNIEWQVIRVKARQQKGASNKVNLVIGWLLGRGGQKNKERVINWLIMSRMGYKDQVSKAYYTQALEELEFTNFSEIKESNNFSKNSNEDLLMVHRDLARRKWGFFYDKAPKSHVRFMNELETELTTRGLY